MGNGQSLQYSRKKKGKNLKKKSIGKTGQQNWTPVSYHTQKLTQNELKS